MALFGSLWPFLALVLMVLLLFAAEQRFPDAVTRIEEGTLAIILALITLVSFGQVIARYGFNGGWGGALEFTRILFAWMILFGMSYAVKINAHLGVDVFVRMLPQPWFRIVAVFGALSGVFYALILIYSDWLQIFGTSARGGAVDYWSKMFRIGIGLEDLRYPGFMQWLFGLQERVHRWVAYLILPIGLALFAFRCTQAAIDIAQGKRDLVIAGHEAEDLVAENKDVLKD
ncbi:MAG TPA: TRAP transporter small permease [Devosia sp.]|nr:TRAP transporter small permease [Devosia sp.]